MNHPPSDPAQDAQALAVAPSSPDYGVPPAPSPRVQADSAGMMVVSASSIILGLLLPQRTHFGIVSFAIGVLRGTTADPARVVSFALATVGLAILCLGGSLMARQRRERWWGLLTASAASALLMTGDRVIRPYALDQPNSWGALFLFIGVLVLIGASIIFLVNPRKDRAHRRTTRTP